MIKQSTKKCVSVFFLCYNVLLIKFVVWSFIILGVAAINEQQRHEIQRLKSELTEAFDNENKNAAADSAIVQPLWTQSEDKSFQTKSLKVQLNAKNRKETAAIRAEINKAVDKDNYATAGAAKIQDIKSLEASFGTKEKGKAAFLTDSLGNQSQTASLEAEYVGSGVTNNNQSVNLKAPNVITANVGDDSMVNIRQLQSLEISKRRTREVLILKYIEEDFSFAFGAEVNEWKHIIHAGQEYFIGRRVTDLLVIRKDGVKYEAATVVDIGHIITCIETYTYWNLKQQQQEGVILIGTEDKVLWYRANQETKQIEPYWYWLVGNTITGLTHFTIDSKEYLTISSNQSFYSGRYALNIYEYQLDAKEFWIAQRLQLQYPCEEVTVLNSGIDVILAIAQNNTAEIYTFNPHEADSSYVRFELKRSVHASGILTIAGFKMGGRNYLGLTGYEPQILLYQQGNFLSKTLLANNFGLVELFFPIAVRTYRDDLLLLVQHKVAFSTHTLTVVETLIWDGETFETSIPVPCHLGKHVMYGVGCMLDLQRDEGMKGAALLNNGDEISVIVPRYKADSGLFRFHTELLPKNSELLDLQEIFNYLKDWVKEQDDLIDRAETFLKIPNEELIKHQSDLRVIDSLKTPEFVFNGEVGEIYVNNYKWTNEDSLIDLDWVIQDIEELGRSLNFGRQRRNLDDVFYEDLNFDEVSADELELENYNGQQFFIQNGELNFDGLVKFSELQVLEKLTGLRKRESNDESLIFQSDLQFDKINGVNWSDIKDNLVFKNQKQLFEELEVNEEIFVEKPLNINTLNTLNFPDDYLLSNGPAVSTVEAEKHFSNTLSVSSVDTSGLVNEKNPADAITLTDEQEWQGMPTFKYLEVTEIYDRVHGHGGEDKFPKNFTLQESNTVEATCHFNELVVHGPIVLRGEMDRQPLGARLKDIILRSQNPSDEILVPSLKTFDYVTFPIDFHLQNNTINQIPVNDFVTAHTKQVLDITSLEGYFYFYNLTLNGSYDGVNIENLLEEVILLEKPIDLSTTELIFPEEIKANSISILDTINKQSIKDNFQTLQEDLNIKSAEFENLQSQQADFSQEILGHGKLNNIELDTLINERSWHEPPVRGNIFLNELTLERGLQTDELHGIRAEFLLDFLNKIDELPDMVLNGQIQVDHITVTGDVQLHKLNRLLFDEDIQLTTVKLNRPNFLSTSLSFKSPLNISGHLNVIGDYRGEYLPDIINDIVVRSTNSCIEIKAPKSFLKPVKVFQNTQVKALNGIPMENIAWMSKENNFQGSVHLKGNLVINDINLQGKINNLDWNDLQNLLYFDKKLKSFVLKNTIEFKNSQFLEDLTVKGDMNEVANLADLFDNLIYKNQSCLLKGKNTFTGRVSIDQGAFITTLNGQDLAYLLNNLVFIDGPEPVVIQTPVMFEDSIIANEIQVETSLNVETLSDCSIREWLDGSLRIDKDQNIPHALQFSAGTIDDNSLSVHFINDKNLSRIITLNTPQTFNETVTFSDVVLNGFISSKGAVNGLDLEEEFNNTLMTSGHQHISTPLNIQSIVVLGNVSIRGLVNSDKNLEDVATLHEDLVLVSPIYFQSIYSPHVIVKDLVTGLDINEWFESAVKYRYPDTQYISGNWSAKHLKVETGPTDFQHMINGFEPRQYYSYKRSARSDNEKEISEYKEICQLIKQIWQELSTKSVHIKYVETFSMDLGKQYNNSNETLNKLFCFKANQQHFLLINLKCKSHIFKWLSQENKFIFVNSFESGPIDEIEVIPAFNNSRRFHFITNFFKTEQTNCSSKAVNKWKLEDNSIVLVDDLPMTSYLLYRSQGNNTSLWSLHNETIEELDLEYKIKQKWQLPVERNKTQYRFVPLRAEQEILLTNGEYLVLLSNDLEKKLKKTSFNSKENKFVQSSYNENLKVSNTESLLKPNTSLTLSLVFDDFKHIVEHALIDLSQYLNQQINITQLSIPESDLLDEHLVPDFLSIMEELQKQSVYSPEVFNISFDVIPLPRSPAQVLAARVVQISWPVVAVIEKIHSYLRSNTSHNHPLCARITESLGFLIKDVLVLAHDDNNCKDENAHNEKLTDVIERIRAFDKELLNFVIVLDNQKDIQSEIKNLEKEQLEFSSTNREMQILSQNQDHLIFLKNSHLSSYEQGEILSVQVGTSTNIRHLWAVTNTKAYLAANNNPGIYLYLESLKGELYQVIPATTPRSVQQLRIKQETYLLYIDDCCQVQILKYRGIQGFEQFSEIHSEEYIKQIITVTLSSDQGNFKHLIVMLLENNIKSYEFVVEGFDFPIASIVLDCL